MNTKIKERLKSKVVWLAILAQVVVVVAVFSPQIAEELKTISIPIIEIVTLIGILNNPTDKEGF